MLDKIKDFLFQLFLFISGCILSLLYGEPLPVRNSRKVSNQNVQVLIIGAGISGIAVAKKLNDIGLTGYTILEQGADLGGTWFWNKYPGVECDIAAVTYSFSWYHNPNWSRLFPGADEIQTYLVECAKSQGITSHIKFNTSVEKCEWQEESGTWKVTTTSDDVYEANVVVHAAGMLHHPKYPDIPGLEDFEGVKVHSARWDRSLDLTDKRVSIIGTGCSAVQIVPSIIDNVKKLTLFQRSAPWVNGKTWFTKIEKSQYFQRLYDFTARTYTNYLGDLLWVRTSTKPGHGWFSGFSIAEVAKAYTKMMMQDAVQSPELKEKIIPDYEIGQKRPTMSDDYLKSMNKPNFSLVTSGIKNITKNSIVTKNEGEIETDVLIFATGFDCLKSINSFDVIGQNGQHLKDFWKNSPKAFKGICVPKMPNFFIMFGPNTTDNRMLMSEAAANYVSESILELALSNSKSMTVKKEKFDKYNESLKKIIAGKTYSSVNGSYYDDGDGFNWLLYPWLHIVYQFDTFRCNRNDFNWT